MTARVFDGHNDILTSVHRRDAVDEFLHGGGATHLDMPRMLGAGFSGIFAIMPASNPAARRVPGAGRYGRVDQTFAHAHATSVLAMTLRLERVCDALHVVRDADDLDANGVGVVVHFEGAEAIDTGLNALEVFHAAGLRSLGLVWSRPNDFAEGVPFEFPASPDTGPGLTAAGRDLVTACNDLGVAVDLSHLNEQGFWDVAKLSRAPLIASHSNAHALCPMTRNLTDAQLDAVAASGGIVGVNFGVGFLSEHGPQADASTPCTEIVRHAVYLAGRMGVEHVGLGSDFDGTRIPADLGDVAGLARLLDLLGKEFGTDDVERIAYANWHRVLRHTWSPLSAG